MILLLLLVQPDPADELRDVVRALREERAAAYARRRARAAEIEAARAPLKRLEIELSELRQKEAESEKALADARAELDSLRSAAAAEDAAAKALGPPLEAAFAHFKELVRAGIPYRRDERAARLGEGGAAPERLARLWTFAQEELRVARSGEAWTAEVALPDGRAKPARLFRAGHLLCGFVSEDGREGGFWSNGAWAAGQDEDVRKAVEMLDRQRPPGFLLFPIQGRTSK